MDLQREQKQDYFNSVVRAKVFRVTNDFCNPATLKELIFRKHTVKVKSLILSENLDQKAPGLVCC